MDQNRKPALLWKIPLVAAFITALFWSIYYLVVGSVPTVETVQLTKDVAFQLPFTISRWTDVLFAPILAYILVSIFTNKRVVKRTELLFGLSFGLLFGLVYGLIFGLIYGLGTVLKFVFSATFWQSVLHRK